MDSLRGSAGSAADCAQATNAVMRIGDFAQERGVTATRKHRNAANGPETIHLQRT